MRTATSDHGRGAESTETVATVMPVIDDTLVLRWRLGALVGAAGTLIGSTIFLTALYLKVDSLEKSVTNILDELRAMRHGEHASIASPSGDERGGYASFPWLNEKGAAP